MLDMLNQRKELDVQFTYEKGEDGTGFDSVIFVPCSLPHAYLQAAMTSTRFSSSSVPLATSSMNLEED